MSKSDTFHIITLGCPKNVVDSENMAALLEKAGFVQIETPQEAKVIIVNTCCFIEPARMEAVETILEAAGIKMQTGGFLIVTGCFPQKFKDELADEIPEVDSWIGLEDPGSIAELVVETVKGQRLRSYYGNPCSSFPDIPRKISTPSHYAYLKIAEGCSHHCNFCAIPEIRGPYHSRPMEKVVEEANQLAAAGHKEIILIAQDTTRYGVDIYKERALPELLRRLCQIDGLHWLRLMYAYPSYLDDQLLHTIADEEKICKYIDIPLQHFHPDVLKKMGRPTGEKSDGLRLVEKIKSIIPNAAIRTSLIVGHPGETPSRFQYLLDMVEEAKFYHLGVFAYSPETGTKSALFKTRASGAEAQRRREEVLQLQQEISRRLREKQIGKTIPAVAEYLLEEEARDGGLVVDLEGGTKGEASLIPPGTTAVGRTVLDAPDIDGLLFIKGDPPPPGTFFNAKITGAGEYDLTGEKI